MIFFFSKNNFRKIFRLEPGTRTPDAGTVQELELCPEQTRYEAQLRRMGINGLLKALAPATTVTPLQQLKGQRVAIDASGWLHKAIYAAAEDFIDTQFNDSQLYVDYILHRCKSMRDMGVEPVMVFDGKRHLLKSETQGKREESRHSNLESARRLVASLQSTGDQACAEKLRAEAVTAAQRGLGVSHDMEVHHPPTCPTMLTSPPRPPPIPSLPWQAIHPSPCRRVTHTRHAPFHSYSPCPPYNQSILSFS